MTYVNKLKFSSNILGRTTGNFFSNVFIFLQFILISLIQYKIEPFYLFINHFLFYHAKFYYRTCFRFLVYLSRTETILVSSTYNFTRTHAYYTYVFILDDQNVFIVQKDNVCIRPPTF